MRQIHVEHSKTADIMVTLLVRFSEIFSIQYIPGRLAFVFTFVIDHQLDQQELLKLQSEVKDSIELYSEFEAPVTQAGSLNHFLLDHYTFLTYDVLVRDFHLVELQLLTGLIRNRYEGKIIADDLHLRNDTLLRQEAKIQTFLEGTKESLDESWVDSIAIEAIRDGSRVFVYNKS